tara:strand:- start:3837 stop:4505 length:669 start_codon:yes stop_codon:yes gene_type:complete
MAFIITNADMIDHRSNNPLKVIKFTTATIFIEQNSVDGDTEVVMQVKGGDIGLRNFTLKSPSNNILYTFNSPSNNKNLGGREILIESPEPKDLNLIFKAYPEGEYIFSGEDHIGQKYYSSITLVHNIPDPAIIISPKSNSTIKRSGLIVEWNVNSPMQYFIVELKNAETEMNLEVVISGTKNQFIAPESWLEPNSEYQVSIFSVDQYGNRTATETNFYTMAE